MAFLDAVENSKVNKADNAPEYWTQLQQNPGWAVSWRTGQLALFKSGVSSDREEIVNQLLPLAKEKSDPGRGRKSMNPVVR
jgi:hypothetical protein